MVGESNKTPITPRTSNTPLSPLEFPRAYSPLIPIRISSFGAVSGGSQKDPQSQGLLRDLNPLSEIVSDELLWEAG